MQRSLATGPGQTAFNRQSSDDASAFFSVLPCSALRNHLVFIHSELGEHFYAALYDKSRAAFWQLENDPLTGESMAGLGRPPPFRGRVIRTDRYACSLI